MTNVKRNEVEISANPEKVLLLDSEREVKIFISSPFKDMNAGMKMKREGGEETEEREGVEGEEEVRAKGERKMINVVIYRKGVVGEKDHSTFETLVWRARCGPQLRRFPMGSHGESERASTNAVDVSQVSTLLPLPFSLSLPRSPPLSLLLYIYLTMHCREIQRCTIFIGLYGERYGWSLRNKASLQMSPEDELLKRSIEVSPLFPPSLPSLSSLSLSPSPFFLLMLTNDYFRLHLLSSLG